jgi:hypothetical protein
MRWPPTCGRLQVRVHFLAQLMHEGASHLRQHLTASVLGRKVFCMPFHRGTQVTPRTLPAMAAALTYCQKVRTPTVWRVFLHMRACAKMSGSPSAGCCGCVLTQYGIF